MTGRFLSFLQPDRTGRFQEVFRGGNFRESASSAEPDRWAFRPYHDDANTAGIRCYEGLPCNS